MVAAGLGAWAAGECSEECCLCRPCDCLGNSSLGAAQIIKSGCVAGASLVCLFFVFCFFCFCFLVRGCGFQ